MKRKKQIVALLMVALMVIGGILPTPSSIGSVRAEEMQTEAASVSPGNVADVQPAESDVDQTEVLAPDLPEETPTEEPGSVSGNEGEIVPGDSGDEEEVLPSVSGNGDVSNTVGYYIPTVFGNVPMEEGTVDFSNINANGLPAQKDGQVINYGN